MPEGRPRQFWNSVFFVLLLCDLGAITWYLWKIPDQDLQKWKKVVSTIASWSGSLLGFLGVQRAAKKQSIGELLALPYFRLTIGVGSIFLWLFIGPFHSISLLATDVETAKPLAGVLLALDDSRDPRQISDGNGRLRLNGLVAAPHHLHLTKSLYQAGEWSSGFADVLPGSGPIRVALTRAKGTVHLQSVPDGAGIFLDGKTTDAHGTTPQQLELPAGPHTVSFQKAGYEATGWEPFFVPAGGEATFERPIHQPPVKADTRTYSLTVASDPSDAEIYIDGRFRGRTPVELQVHRGSVSLELKKPGFVAAKDEVSVPGRSIVTLTLLRNN